MYQMFKKIVILFVREISVDWNEFKTDISLKNVIKSNSIALIFYLLKISFITHKEKDRWAYTQCTRIGILTPPTPYTQSLCQFWNEIHNCIYFKIKLSWLNLPFFSYWLEIYGRVKFSTPKETVVFTCSYKCAQRAATASRILLCKNLMCLKRAPLYST